MCSYADVPTLPTMVPVILGRPTTSMAIIVIGGSAADILLVFLK